MKGNLVSVALILVGVVALAINFGLLDVDFVGLIKKWWPLALVVLGIGLYFTPDDSRRS